jgi:hypothetical protein
MIIAGKNSIMKSTYHNSDILLDPAPAPKARKNTKNCKK